MLMSRYTGRGG